LLTQIDVVYSVPLDTWTAATTYPIGQLVLDPDYGQVYQASVETLNESPRTSPGSWALLGDQWAKNVPSTKSESLALPIMGVNLTNSLLLREVTGLNPPAIDLFIGEYARDGGFYGGRRVGQRNVVLTIDLNPNPALAETAQGLRELLYKIFIDPAVQSDHIQLVLHDDDNNSRTLAGYVDTFETDLFGTDTIAQISIVCPDPYINDVTATELRSPTGTWLVVPFNYNGTAETGLETEIYMSVDSSKLNINNNGFVMALTHPFVSTDVIYVNTNRGSRTIRLSTLTALNAMRDANPSLSTTQIWEKLIAEGSTTSLLPKLSLASPWIELHSATNKLRVYGNTFTDSVAGIKSLTFRSSFWGV
jgi:hypothetical protein